MLPSRLPTKQKTQFKQQQQTNKNFCYAENIAL